MEVKMRKFEIISYEQYDKDLKGKCLYSDITLPSRSTKHSAGYDFKSPIKFTLNPGEIIKVPTGIKAAMNDDEFLAILVRSSMGFKYNIRLCNQVGIIDSDYYNNEGNEGHIFIALQNEGDKVFEANVGDNIAQGIFLKYNTIDNEEEIKSSRSGGMGSTNK
ncbi:MAG: deoxyuridine 5'-triphosphate nucleotidohydrolase [Bacilli bacterium]|nr:deoxyuridine 5'-triphosphate nucleotidohydrolase [Bacilli bacterium]